MEGWQSGNAAGRYPVTPKGVASSILAPSAIFML